MKPVLITQRVDVVASYGERRDALDQQWTRFLRACGLLAVPVANDRVAALTLADRVQPTGIVLSGGNDPMALGGTAPERDDTEAALIDWANRRDVPVLGVCRGMQVLLLAHGTDLAEVPGHIAVRHRIALPDGQRTVNSYHRYAACRLAPPLEGAAGTDEGVVEAFRHPTRPIAGIMWHPERESPFDPRDIALFQTFFADGSFRILP